MSGWHNWTILNERPCQVWKLSKANMAISPLTNLRPQMDGESSG